MNEEILKKEAFIEEEIKCLEWCYKNPDECDQDEIDERENYIEELQDELYKLINTCENP